MERESSPTPRGWFVETRVREAGVVEVRCARVDEATGRRGYLAGCRLARPAGWLARWCGDSLEQRLRRAIDSARRRCWRMNDAERVARQAVAAAERGVNG